jgi:hypothetical protein
MMLFTAAFIASRFTFADFLEIVIFASLGGLVSGFIVAKQIEAGIVFVHFLRRRASRKTRASATLKSVRERLDDESTPFAAPPGFGLPRRFGIRGMLIATTWAAIVMGGLRASGARPTGFFLVITFVAGVMAAQVLLFNGRKPFKASMFAGAFLLPAEMLALTLIFDRFWYPAQMRLPPFLLATIYAGSCAYYVCVGIIFGAVAGAVSGWLYYLSEELFLLLTNGLPSIALEPIADTDADALMAWISGPQLCHRWAGNNFRWPLDREQLLGRFATTQGERPTRQIFKAVDSRTGNMLGYFEFGEINYDVRDAWLELAIVDPDASERGRIGVLLLRAAAHEAFETLDLISLKISTNMYDLDLSKACSKAWSNDHSYRRPLRKDSLEPAAVYRSWRAQREDDDDYEPAT